LSYFSLEKKNTILINENLELINRIKKLESDYRSVVIDTSTVGFLSAQVINNSLNKSKNYITIDKGFKDGVRENLGVISSNGVIGKVKYVSDNFSTIISLLNTSFYLSTLVDETKTLSSINWDGKNPREVKLLYVPKHVPLEIGYSVITSSFDSIFPKGIEVGKISSINEDTNSNFYDVDILLSEDFYSIYNVYLVKSFPFEEKINLENID
jgi:rod shape-determining protein MreC|tara:strand:+ start:1413 stop:2045 length:633 start_codon:yes stop_codon:yes gene_type:complete